MSDVPPSLGLETPVPAPSQGIWHATAGYNDIYQTIPGTQSELNRLFLVISSDRDLQGPAKLLLLLVAGRLCWEKQVRLQQQLQHRTPALTARSAHLRYNTSGLTVWQGFRKIPFKRLTLNILNVTFQSLLNIANWIYPFLRMWTWLLPWLVISIKVGFLKK